MFYAIALAVRASLVVIRHALVVCRIFWPTLLVMVLVTIGQIGILMNVGALAMHMDELTDYLSFENAFVDLAILLITFVLPLLALPFLYGYQWVVAASGLIQWHRFLIENKASCRGRFWLQQDEWWFFGQWLILGIASLLLSVLVYWIAVGGIIMLPGNLGGLSNWYELTSGRRFYEYMTAFWLPGIVLVCIIWPRSFLSLAAIAIKQDVTFSDKARFPLHFGNRLSLSIAMVLITVPLFLAKMLVERVMFNHQSPIWKELGFWGNYVIRSFPGTVMSLVGVIVFAALLSLFFRRLSKGPQQTTTPSDQAASAP